MKTVLITGANKSIGFETAKQMIEAGYYVYLGSRDIEKGNEAVEKLKAEGMTAVEAIAIDISSDDSIKAARAAVGTKTNSLDVLINNAGISGGFPQNALTTKIETVREVFATNLFGTIEVTNNFLDLLKKSDAPRIVNVTSGLGSITLHNDPSWQYYKVKSAAYGPSKSALNAYTVVLAYELKDTVFKVNVVDPGYTATDFNNHGGPRHVTDAAKDIVKFATLDETGRTEFFTALIIMRKQE